MAGITSAYVYQETSMRFLCKKMCPPSMCGRHSLAQNTVS